MLNKHLRLDLHSNMCSITLGVCDECKKTITSDVTLCEMGKDGFLCVDSTRIRRGMVGPIEVSSQGMIYLSLTNILRNEIFVGTCKDCHP